MSPATPAIKLDEGSKPNAAHPAVATSNDSASEENRGGVQVDLAVSRELLDNPSKRRFFIVKNARDGNAEQQVASVVERTTRFNFCKITVAQGIVIDPRHPDQATVFASLVNPNDVDRMLDQLKSVLPDAIEEMPADPVIVTKLADISQVQASPPLADVMILREDLALKTRVEGSVETAARGTPISGRQSSAEAANNHPRNESLARSTPARSTGERRALARAAAELYLSNASAHAVARSPDSVPMNRVASSQSVGLVSLGEPDKSKDLVVVFVWVCHSKPS
jgi:hypothetical protein